jgi:hypothetical protein
MRNQEINSIDKGSSGVAAKTNPRGLGEGVGRVEGIKRVLWKGTGIVVFQDTRGKYWKYEDGRVSPAVVMGRKEQ